MRNFILTLILFAASNLCFADPLVTFTFYNFTSEAGTVFLGDAPPVMGPAVQTDGNSVQWTTTLSGNQVVGLVTASGGTQICYVNTGTLILSQALYTGDMISVLFGQPQFPTGISCGCYGSVCSTG